MELQFDEQHIQGWADFSGDWNPIHFDPAVARQIQANDVVVHGMIPIVTVLDRAHGQLLASAAAPGWTEATVRLKKPIEARRPLWLRLTSGAASVSFSLESENGKAVHLRGQVRAAEAPAAPKIWAETPGASATTRAAIGSTNSVSHQPLEAVVDLPVLRVDGERVRARQAAFGALFPDLTHDWVGLSAQLFADFLIQHAPAVHDAALRTFGERAQTAVVVQTGYGITFSDERVAGALRAKTPLTCVFDQICLVRLERDCAGEVVWSVRASADTHDAVIMQMRVGLLMRAVSEPVS